MSFVIIAVDAYVIKNPRKEKMGQVTYLGGKSTWITLLRGKMKVFSVILKSADEFAPSKILTRVGV